MISEKMIKLAQGGSAIRALFEEGNRLAAIYGRENIYDFSLGNPNIPAPEKVKEVGIRILSESAPMDVHGYMSNSGYAQVRRAVAENLNKRFGTAFGENNIIMTVGAAGGLHVIFKTLLNPGDEVLVFSPYFLEYGNYVGNYDAVLKAIPAKPEDNFQPSAEVLREAITEKTKILLLNNPNNPTGVVYTEETIKALAAVLNEKQKELGTSIYLVSDEPYRELCYDGVEPPFLTKYYENTLIGYSWSKSLSLPGERIGYIVVPNEVEDFQLVYDAAVVANRMLGYVNAPSLMQLIVAECLDEQTDIGAYDKNRKLLYNGLTDCGFECVYPSGAFYMWVKAPDGDDKAFSAAAKKYNILVVPGSSFACGGYVRVAYCVAYETIAKSMPAFKKLAEEYGLKK